MKPEPDFEALAKTLNPTALMDQSWVLAGGISASMWGMSLSYRSGRQQKVVVRAQPNKTERGKTALEQEFRLLTVAGQSGLPTSEPLLLDPTGEIGRIPTIILGYIEGEISFKRDRLTTRLRELARTLAQIHQIGDKRVEFLAKSGPSLPRAAAFKK